MNFLLPRNRPRVAFLRAFGGALSFAAAIFFLQWLAPNLFAPVAMSIARPLFFARDSAATGLASLGAFFSSKTALSEENSALTDALSRAHAENEFLKALSSMNGQQESAAPAPKPDRNTLIVAVLARPRWSAYDTLLIGAGAADGIVAGARVFANGFVIGEVAEIQNHHALVSLYSTAGKKVVAQISGRFPVEIVGSGGGTFEAFVPSNAPVSAGDGAFASGISSQLFAVVDTVTSANEGTSKLYLRLPVNIFELHTVEIGL